MNTDCRDSALCLRRLAGRVRFVKLSAPRRVVI